ncbi:hypothetical protein [Pseudaquabacterium rugosum]|uniref:Uncharacterized protein n=1 Tax=Pseudaquabacterium rugosum TaxID=2984194 RepID=A0ABU9BEE1_9BURK
MRWFFRTNTLHPTNYAAEQMQRNLLHQRKIFRPTNTLRGNLFVARGFTERETCRWQKRDLWKFVQRSCVHPQDGCFGLGAGERAGPSGSYRAADGSDWLAACAA